MVGSGGLEERGGRGGGGSTCTRCMTSSRLVASCPMASCICLASVVTSPNSAEDCVSTRAAPSALTSRAAPVAHRNQTSSSGRAEQRRAVLGCGERAVPVWPSCLGNGAATPWLSPTTLV